MGGPGKATLDQAGISDNNSVALDHTPPLQTLTLNLPRRCVSVSVFPLGGYDVIVMGSSHANHDGMFSRLRAAECHVTCQCAYCRCLCLCLLLPFNTRHACSLSSESLPLPLLELIPRASVASTTSYIIRPALPCPVLPSSVCHQDIQILILLTFQS